MAAIVPNRPKPAYCTLGQYQGLLSSTIKAHANACYGSLVHKKIASRLQLFDSRVAQLAYLKVHCEKIPSSFSRGFTDLLPSHAAPNIGSAQIQRGNEPLDES